MYVIHSTIETEPAAIETMTPSADDRAVIVAARGFVHRIMLRDRTRPGTFHYVTVWQSEADHHAYRDQVIAETKRRIASSGVVFDSYDRIECDVLYSDAAQRLPQT